MQKNVGLLAQVTAKAGKETAVADFLKSALALAQAEPETATWYAFQINSNTFGIFDTFPGEPGRQAHLNGPIAAALMANAAELLAAPPDIKTITVLASK
ncbi:MAG TPA: antibiotic biosynthesis monooxygenase [Chitinophagaceae bacterium]|jgi:quinol monooxygenase YgiN